MANLVTETTLMTKVQLESMVGFLSSWCLFCFYCTWKSL